MMKLPMYGKIKIMFQTKQHSFLTVETPKSQRFIPLDVLIMVAQVMFLGIVLPPKNYRYIFAINPT
jgi:hypothetical protein